jgi:putative ABC transport system ATP-binding protein
VKAGREAGETRVQEQADRPLVELVQVVKAYGAGQSTIRALDDLSLAIPGGQLVVVLGPSGSGKTTLLNIIGALDTPTTGRVSVAGRELTGASRRDLARIRRSTVSFVFQSFNPFPGLTALENVQFAVDVAENEVGASAAEVLERVGLGDRLNQFPHQLSGGEQQRVAVARALATGNPVLLADEPTGELDFHTGVRILELLQAQAGPGRVVLIVTHNREIARCADRVIELSGGRVISDGPPEGGKADVGSLFW